MFHRTIRAARCLALAPAITLLLAGSSLAQQDIDPVGRLEGGATFTGSISPATDIDTFGFRAIAGDGIQMRLVDSLGTALQPEVTVYRPNGTYYTADWDTEVAVLTFSAPVTGPYRVTVQDRTMTNTGPYALYFTRAPGANEFGLLSNGDTFTERIDRGELDSYTFYANQGEGVQLRVSDSASTELDPQIYVYDPNGAYYTWDWDPEVAVLSFDAPMTGIFTVVVADYGSGNGNHDDTGFYDISFTRAPGAAEHGALVNGGVRTQEITRGDLDSYSFQATQGEGIQLRLNDINSTALAPQMYVYYPNGSYYTWDWDPEVAVLAFDAPFSGTYTVVVADYGSGSGNHDDTGTYELHFTRAPDAAEHGALVNGGVRTEEITRGDLDSYSFQATQGEGIQLRLNDINSTALAPQMYVYYPNGAYYTWDWDPEVAVLAFDAPFSGTYTVVVADYGSGSWNHDDTGTYELHFTRAPDAAEHGALVNGGVRTEEITRGDLDSYSFQATQGEGIQLRLNDVNSTALAPQMYVYYPNGSYYTWDWDPEVAALAFDAPFSGTYTVVVADYGSGSSNHDDTGTYELYFTRAPDANEHGTLTSGVARNEVIDRGDLDSYRFVATQGQSIRLDLTDVGGTALDPQMYVYAPNGSYYTWDWDVAAASVAFSAPQTGTYTVVVADYGSGSGNHDDTGAYQLLLTRP